MSKFEDSMASLSRAKAFLFDLDGTLIRSAVDFVKLKKETIQRLSELGVDTKKLSAKMKTYEIMSFVRELEDQKKLRSYSTISEEVTKVWNRVELETVEKTERIPGTDAALTALKSRRIGIGVITRGCRAYATEALRITRLLPFVDVVLGRDDTWEAKPSPEPLFLAMARLRVEPCEAVMVGDTIDDATCARKAGVLFVGVLTGLSDRETLTRIGSTMILKSVAELPILLEK